ncbi:MAG: amidohydrolase [Fuerstiella sp.]|nr:amidohydrolase [Fuerstiella sp.]
MNPQLTISRRQAIATGVAVTASTRCSARSSEATGQTPWIDAHSHIWTPDTSIFKLAPGTTSDDLAPRSFTDDELMAVARPHGVGRVVLIQHSPFHGFDNTYLIDAWRRHPETFRVVGIVDDLRKNCAKAMKQFLQSGVTGFRIAPRKGISDWLNTDGMVEMWKTAVDTRQPMCCLIDADQLPAVDAACQRHPETPVVIDHFARIGVDGTIRDSDLARLCHLANHEHVKVKISAYYALGRKQSPHHELIPMIKRLYESYGPDRLMWASDCPYQLTGSSTYASSIDLVLNSLDFVNDHDRQKLLATTAERTFFYV